MFTPNCYEPVINIPDIILILIKDCTQELDSKLQAFRTTSQDILVTVYLSDSSSYRTLSLFRRLIFILMSLTSTFRLLYK